MGWLKGFFIPGIYWYYVHGYNQFIYMFIYMEHVICTLRWFYLQLKLLHYFSRTCQVLLHYYSPYPPLRW